jgi:hypothetical protein
MGRAGALPSRSSRLACGASVLLLVVITGCGGESIAPPQSDAQDRLSKLLNLYRYYAEKNKKGPANEEALREFGKSLSPQERADHLIGDEFNDMFTSPRDNQKFTVKYNMRPEPATSRALAWETTGKNGMHWVALTNGYVVEHDEQQLKEYTK